MRTSKMFMLAVFSALSMSACKEMVSDARTYSAVTRPLPKPQFLLMSTGMAAPISDLRYYDGTYTGTPGTGSVDYIGNTPGTLYRDNEAYPNGACNGEGCGSHPAVDIPISSNTPIYATYTGRVFHSMDNGCFSGGWGGLVTIKADNPYKPNQGDSIYFSYAHLNARYVQGSPSSGDHVTTGQQIGLSGGASGDVCPGNSTGAHLHFQIDRSDGDASAQGCVRIPGNSVNGIPWFPSNVNTQDNSFIVTKCTYNPMTFVRGGYYWTFWQAVANGQFKEYWTGVNGTLSVTTNGGQPNTDQALLFDGGSDPWVWRGNGNITCPDISGTCSTQIAVEANLYPNVGVDLNKNNCSGNPFVIYFITNISSTWGEDKKVEVYPSAQQEFHVRMSANANWTGIIKGIRIDPSPNCSAGYDPIYIGYVTIERPGHSTLN